MNIWSAKVLISFAIANPLGKYIQLMKDNKETLLNSKSLVCSAKQAVLLSPPNDSVDQPKKEAQYQLAYQFEQTVCQYNQELSKYRTEKSTFNYDPKVHSFLNWHFSSVDSNNYYYWKAERYLDIAHSHSCEQYRFKLQELMRKVIEFNLQSQANKSITNVLNNPKIAKSVLCQSPLGKAIYNAYVEINDYLNKKTDMTYLVNDNETKQQHNQQQQSCTKKRDDLVKDIENELDYIKKNFNTLQSPGEDLKKHVDLKKEVVKLPCDKYASISEYSQPAMENINRYKQLIEEGYLSTEKVVQVIELKSMVEIQKHQLATKSGKDNTKEKQAVIIKIDELVDQFINKQTSASDICQQIKKHKKVFQNKSIQCNSNLFSKICCQKTETQKIRDSAIEIFQSIQNNECNQQDDVKRSVPFNILT